MDSPTRGYGDIRYMDMDLVYMDNITPYNVGNLLRNYSIRYVYALILLVYSTTY